MMARLSKHAVSAATLALALGLGAHPRPARAAPLTKLTVICNSWVGFAPIFVAQALGYDRDLGIDVSVRFDDAKSDALVALERGDVNIDMMTIDDAQRLPWESGKAGVIIGTIDESIGGDGVIAAGDIHDVTDLKGKIVATDMNIPATLLLELELAKHNMTLKDLKVREMSGSEAVATFADSSVAAVGTYQPDMGKIMQVDTARKPHVLVSSAGYPGYIVDVAVVTKAEAASAQPALKAFLAGVYKAVALFSTDQALFAKTAAPHYGLSVADFLGSIQGSLVYTDLAKSQAYMGGNGAPGTLGPIFAQIMQMNLSTGAATTSYKPADMLDDTIISQITPASLH